MSEQEKPIILTEAERKQYEDVVVERWLQNSERVNQQLRGREYKPEFRFGTHVDKQLRLALLQWLQSPPSYNGEQGYLVVGERQVEETGTQVPRLATTSHFVEMSGGAVHTGATSIGLDLGIAGYYLTHSFPDATIEPIALVHAHPRRLPDKALKYSPSDNKYATNFLSIPGLPPIRGIYVGLAALPNPNQVALKMRTAVSPQIAITKSFVL